MKKSVSIIGGGATALLVAALLDSKKFKVTIYEKNKTLGRKFLVAGKGGFNLTHSEPIDVLVHRYTPSFFLQEALINFDNQDFINWIRKIGIPTYIGSSKRVYPKKGIKPIAVLNAILTSIDSQGVTIKNNHIWTGWSANNVLLFNSHTQIKSDYTVFALGGSSWEITGSDGLWVNLFKAKNIVIEPFQASNCAYKVGWHQDFINQHEGIPFKNIAVRCLNKTQKGELVLTRFGIEGNAIYALSPQIREELSSDQKATIYLDLKPTLSDKNVFEKIKNSKFKKTSEILLKELKLTPAQIDLLKKNLSKETYLNTQILAATIKNLRIEITDSGSLNEAISTTGGISLHELDKNFELKKMHHTYCIGEMLDWDAPTGGYLLQACFSMGAHVARHLNTE